MTTIKLRVNDKILDEVMTALNQFNLDDLEIIESEEPFKTNKQSLENELERAESGKTKNSTIEEVDLFLEETIIRFEEKL